MSLLLSRVVCCSLTRPRCHRRGTGIPAGGRRGEAPHNPERQDMPDARGLWSGYSVAMASSTFIREARTAGMIAASTPNTTAITKKTTSEPSGSDSTVRSSDSD